jgi:hypothetical protein
VDGVRVDRRGPRGKHRRCLYRLVVRRPADASWAESTGVAGRAAGHAAPCFTGPSFATFCGPVAGLCGQVRRRTVCGMLLGAGLSRCWPHDRAHYFFARAAWDLDELGLAVARIVVLLLVPAGEPLVVAVDDSVFRRSGRRVSGVACSTTGRPRPGTSSASGPASSRAGSWWPCRSAPGRCACRCCPGCTCRAGARRSSPAARRPRPARSRPRWRWSPSWPGRSPAGRYTSWPTPATTARRCATCPRP